MECLVSFIWRAIVWISVLNGFHCTALYFSDLPLESVNTRMTGLFEDIYTSRYPLSLKSSFLLMTCCRFSRG